MRKHSLAGCVGVARRDRLHDQSMFGRGNRHQPAVFEIEAAEQRKLLDQLAINFSQFIVAGQFHQPIMEFQVQQVIVIGVLVLHRFFHRIHCAANFFQLYCADVLREFAADQFIHDGAQIKNFHCLFDADIAYKHAAILGDLDEAGFFQHAERLTQWPA